MDKFLAFGVLGLATGAIYAIAASGLVLTYTTSGIFNFAHGALGMVAAFVYWQMRFDWQWPAWISLILVLFVFAPLFGAFIDRVILRGLQGSSEVTKIIVSVGLLVGLIGAVDWIWPPEDRVGFRAFFDGERISLGGNNITYHSIITTVCAIAVAIAPAVPPLPHTFGSVDAGGRRQPGLAELNGARPEPDQCAGVGGEYQPRRPRRHPARRDTQLNVIPLTLLVVNAYAAAIFGRLRNLTATFVGAVILGLANSYLIGYAAELNLDDGTIGSFSLTGIRISVPMIALFIVLLVLPQSRLRGGGLLRRRETTPEPTWSMTIFGVAVGMLFVVGISGWFGRADLLSLNNGLVFALAALSLVPLTGYAGLISLAPLTFAGLGAALMAKLPGGGSIVTLIATMLIVAAIGAVVALPTLRLSGIYLALATGAFAVLMTNLVFNQGAWFPQSNVDVPPLSLWFVEVETPRGQFIMLTAAFCCPRRRCRRPPQEHTRAPAGGDEGLRGGDGHARSEHAGTEARRLFDLGRHRRRRRRARRHARRDHRRLQLRARPERRPARRRRRRECRQRRPPRRRVPRGYLHPRRAGPVIGERHPRAAGNPRHHDGPQPRRRVRGAAHQLRRGRMLRWPLAIGTAGGVLLWALAQYDVISKWTFAVALDRARGRRDADAPGALRRPPSPLARRAAMATLMVAALATAAGIDWGSVGRQRPSSAGDVLYVAVLAIAGRNLLVPAADEATSPDRIGLTERFTPHQITEAESALGVRL